MSFLSKLFQSTNEGDDEGGQGPIEVDAMIGICVHNPDTYIEPPSNVRQTALTALANSRSNARLSEGAKVEFLIAQGAKPFGESEILAQQDLPKQLHQFMDQNGLDPDAYEVDRFSEQLAEEVKVLWATAAPKG